MRKIQMKNYHWEVFGRTEMQRRVPGRFVEWMVGLGTPQLVTVRRLKFPEERLRTQHLQSEPDRRINDPWSQTGRDSMSCHNARPGGFARTRMNDRYEKNWRRKRQWLLKLLQLSVSAKRGGAGDETQRQNKIPKNETITSARPRPLFW